MCAAMSFTDQPGSAVAVCHAASSSRESSAIRAARSSGNSSTTSTRGSGFIACHSPGQPPPDVLVIVSSLASNNGLTDDIMRPRQREIGVAVVATRKQEMRSMLVLSRRDVEALLDLDELVDALADAMSDLSSGVASVPL